MPEEPNEYLPGSALASVMNSARLLAATRGPADQTVGQLAMLTTVSPEDLIPADHPIRKIRVVVDAVLAELDPVFDRMYAAGGRRSSVR